MPYLFKQPRTTKSVGDRETRLRYESLEARRVLTDVAGVLHGEVTWTRSESPLQVIGDITVANDATLVIEPGVDVRFGDGTGIQVQGRLLAEGTPFERITFDRIDGGTRWDGLQFQATRQDSRIAYADMSFGDAQGEAIRVDHSRLSLDNVTWTGTTGTVLELAHPSLVVRNSQFPTSSGGEVIHGSNISDDEYLIIDGNVFANSNNGGDVIDFLGADRPGPVLQILNNVFLGGGDDGIDLDGTDAHVEGNVFMNFRKNTGRATTSNAIATGLPQTGELNRTEITVVRNIFVNNDHAILLKEDAFATVENNVFVDTQEAAIQFGEVAGTAVRGYGKGASMDGNIFFNNARIFKHLVNSADFRTELTVDRSLLPNEPVEFGGTTIMAHELGEGNFDGDPRFVDAVNGNYRLAEDSPAVGAGPDGLDMGAFVPAGPTVRIFAGLDAPGNERTLQVGGPGITHYRYRLNGALYGPVTPVETPIALPDLDAGKYTIDVLAMNDAGEWFAGQRPAFGENHASVISPRRARTGEKLPMVVRVTDAFGQLNSTLSTPATLGRAFDQADIRIKKGVGTAAPIVQAMDDLSYSIGGPFSTTDDRLIELLTTDSPVAEYSGRMEGNSTWDASAERQVTSDLVVPAGSTLTVEAGTRVVLGDKVNLRIEGQIAIKGTQADPVVFNSLDPTRPWGGLQLLGQDARLEYVFFTNGGADTSQAFGHSGSQPVIMVDATTLDCSNCFVIDNVGKAFGSRNDAWVNLDHGVISNVDTGGEFNRSVVNITDSYVKDIPNGDGVFVDDDNDGFYFSGVHSSGEASLVRDSVVISTKDDGVDHNGARLRLERVWIEDAMHEGLAASNEQWVTIVDSVFMHNNQGVEAGYGSPQVSVKNSVIINNVNRSDPDTPVTAGLRFGDGYNGRNGAYLGHIEAANVVLHDNGDNVRNFDGSIPGPKPSAIEITHSMTNDLDFDAVSGNVPGVPVFDASLHLLRGTDGFAVGDDGQALGRILKPLTVSFTVGQIAPSVQITPVANPRVTPVDEVEVVFSEPVTGFDLADIRLDRNGSPVAVTDVVVSITDIPTTFLLSGLQQITQTSGYYELTVGAESSGIFNTAGSPLVDGTSTSWTMFPGDANQDGQFNSRDIVIMLQVGKYNTGRPATWEEGDFNGDGLFDALDVVFALAADTYDRA